MDKRIDATMIKTREKMPNHLVTQKKEANLNTAYQAKARKN